jgi:hypothetical protein
MKPMSVSDAISCLERVLPTHAPELWESLRPAASREDLQRLRDAVAPLEVPTD